MIQSEQFSVESKTNAELLILNSEKQAKIDSLKKQLTELQVLTSKQSEDLKVQDEKHRDEVYQQYKINRDLRESLRVLQKSQSDSETLYNQQNNEIMAF